MAIIPQITPELLSAQMLQKITISIDRLVQESLAALEDLEKVEQALKTALEDVRSCLVHGALEAMQANPPADYYCQKCQKRLTPWSSRTRVIVTRYGEGNLTINRLRCTACRTDAYPLQILNHLQNTHFTLGARHLIAEEAADASYGRAAARLMRLGIPVSSSEVDRIAQEVGQWRQAEEEAVRSYLLLLGKDLSLPLHDVKAWEQADADAAAVVSVDGAKVRSCVAGEKGLEWFEVRAGVMTLAQKNAPKVCVGGDITPDKLFETLYAQTRQLVEKRKRLVFIADGGNWIWSRAQQWFPKAIQVLDIYHAAAHVASAARACWGEGSQCAKEWTDKALLMLMKKRGVDTVLDKLNAVKEQGNVVDRAALDTEMNYLTEHRHRMDYAQLKEKGLPIGSGEMESTIKQMSTQRLRQPGMMWSKKGANGMLRQRGACLSGSLELTMARQRLIGQNNLQKYSEAA